MRIAIMSGFGGETQRADPLTRTRIVESSDRNLIQVHRRSDHAEHKGFDNPAGYALAEQSSLDAGRLLATPAEDDRLRGFEGVLVHVGADVQSAPISCVATLAARRPLCRSTQRHLDGMVIGPTSSARSG